MAKVREVFNTLDLQLKAEKYKVAQSQIELLGFKLTYSGVSPVNIMQGVTERLRPTI